MKPTNLHTQQTLQPDLRRVYFGSVYRLTRLHHSSDKWLLTADGVALSAPYSSYELGVAAMDAVAPNWNP